MRPPFACVRTALSVFFCALTDRVHLAVSSLVFLATIGSVCGDKLFSYHACSNYVMSLSKQLLKQDRPPQCDWFDRFHKEVNPRLATPAPASE